MGHMSEQSVTGHSGAGRRKPAKAGTLRLPPFMTTALSITKCVRCESPALVYAAVIWGLERHLDPLPLSTAGLSAAVVESRWVGVVRPWGPPIAHKVNTGHWWVNRLDGGRPLLLAEHVHDRAPLDPDPALAVELLTRFLPADRAPVDPDAPCPF